MAGLLAICVSPALAKDDAESTSSSGGYDIPTGGSPSPLFGAQPFTQKMLMFEEFGLRNMPTTPSATSGPMGAPSSCTNAPGAAKIDKMIKQVLWPLPMRMARGDMPNPWAAKIGECIGAPLRTSAIEGRPPGELYAFQRNDEFVPKQYFASVQAGARVNTGARDIVPASPLRSG